MRLEPGTDNLFSMRDDVAHSKLRNKMAAGVSSIPILPSKRRPNAAPQYSGKENLSMESTVNEHIAKFVELIRSKYISTDQTYRPMDFAQKAQYFTLDVISDLAFSKAFGFLEQDDDVFDYLKLTSSYIPVMLVLSNVPSIANMLHSRFFRWSLPSEHDKLGFGALIG